MTPFLRPPRRLPAWPLLPVALLVVFGRSVADPSALIVDGDRPSVDRATPPDGLSIGNDLTRLFLPHHARIAESLAITGRVPGWDPAGFGGRPLVGNPQAGLWYPPSWAAWRWWRPSVLGWLTLAHLGWGGVGAYFLAGRLGLAPFSAAVASSCFSIPPYVLAQTYEGHYPHVWSYAWYPWAFWAAIGLRAGRASGWALPPILALASLTGHPQEGYYLALALGLWLTGEVLARLSGGRTRSALLATAAGAAVAVATLGLIAVEVVPDALAHRFALGGGRLPAREAGKYHASFANLAQLLNPRALGGPADYEGPGNYWEPLLSLGWVPLVLVLVAAARSPRRKAVLGWSALVLIAALFAFGGKLAVFRAFFAIAPGMDRFRVPARSLFLAALGSSMLVGLGVEAIGDSRGEWRGWLRGYLAILALLAALIAAATMTIGPSPTKPPTDREAWLRAGARVAADPIFLAAAAGTTAGMAWLRFRPEDRGKVAVALGLLGVGELALHGRALIRVAPASRFLGPDPVGAAIARSGPGGPFRIRARDAFYGDARAFASGFEKTNLNDSFQVRHAAGLYEALYPMFGTVGPPRLARFRSPEIQRAVLERMNVALLVSDRDEPRHGWPVAAEGEWDGVPFAIRKNPNFLPRAYVVPRVAIAPEGPEMLDRFAEVSPREAVLMPSDPLAGVGRRQPYTPAKYRSADPDRVEVSVETEAPGLLVVADTWMPGWAAAIDGRAVPVLRGNGAQRVVAIDREGSHEVVMTYTPPGLAVGKAITAASLGLWGVVAAFAIRENRARSRTRRSRDLGPG